MYGTFREDHPRLTLTLPGMTADLDVEFIVDTGFAGDLALPVHIVNRVDGILIGFRERKLATGQRFRCPSYEIMLDWNEGRSTEVLILEGDPLLGTVLLREYLVQMEMTESGQVAIEPL